ncbi:MAG: TonB-dependent receptor [Lachnospiraceae bacterium]|nr:TonB-dependent receptor [Lachnospiraceae bacterium]
MKRIFIIALAVSAVSSLTAQQENSDSIGSRLLNEVVVKGEKPQIKSKDGVMVVDLPSIVKDKPVSNILEALSYLPGVINNNGMIGLAGASDVTIILNGELTNMPVQNLYQLLYTTPVDRLKSVEVMYTAPSKYHVNGAVINVVLKTPTPLDGLQGQVRAGYNQGHYSSYGGGLAVTYATRDWTFDLNYGLSRTKNWNHEETFSNHLFDGHRTMIEDDMCRISENWTNTIYASASYKNLRFTYNGQITSSAKGRSLSNGTLGSFTNNYTHDTPITYHNIALKYTTRFGLTAGGDYTHYCESRNQSLLQGNDLLLEVLDKQNINRWHLYLDQQHHLGKWQLNYGVEYQRADDSSSQTSYPIEDNNGFSGSTSEDVADAYIELQRSFEWGLSFNVSAKGEYYHNNYRHNWNFIPQLGATYYKTPKSIFQLNLSTIRIYPSYWELRNGTSHINPYSKVLGNPALQPYLNYAGQFSYILNQKYVATLYVQYADKATVQLPYQAPDELSLIYQTINTNYKRTIGLNLNTPISIGQIWNATATVNIFNQREKADHFHDISFDNKKWIIYGALNNTFKLSHNCPVSLSVDLTYISPSIQGISDLSSLWKVDVGVKWRFGKKRCCELNLRSDDIFNRWSPTMTIDHAGQDYRMKVRDMSRNTKLTFIWRFNGFKPKNESNIDTSRFGTGT